MSFQRRIDRGVAGDVDSLRERAFDLLRNRLFSLSVAASVCAFAAQMAALVALPFEIQRLGHSAVETGLLMTPWPLALALAAPLAGRLADRHPAGILGALGLLTMAAGLLLLALFPAHGSVAAFAWRWSTGPSLMPPGSHSSQTVEHMT